MISIENLCLTYRSPGVEHPAVRGITLSVAPGEFCTLLGPSGCGKTTTLRCVAGLEQPDSGKIVIAGRTVFSSSEGINLPAAERDIGMVFQSYAIWPHMSVAENIAFPLRYRKSELSRAQIRDKVREALAMVELAGYEDRPAPMLSGGQQQRLALARALVAEPPVLLLDEPLSNLDAKLRDQMRLEIRHLAQRLGLTTLFVTHEQVEALTMSDVVVVMKDGRIVQRGAPQEIYQAPVGAFVADFIGKINLLSGRLAWNAEDGSHLASVDTQLGRLNCLNPDAFSLGENVTLALRPETIEVVSSALSRTAPLGTNEVEGRVEEVVYLGNQSDCLVLVGEQRLQVQTSPAMALASGDRVVLRLPPLGLRIVQPT